jgi:hypothetical protein
MDRRAGLILALIAACGAPTPLHPPDHQVQVVARGSMAYAVAFAGERLVTVELIERFELVIRSRDGAREEARLELGRPEDDWPALAAAGDRAWVGGETGEVLVIDLAAATVTARWPVGAPVTGLATHGDHVAIADATGVLCLRDLAGALLQCAGAADAPIADLEVRGDLVVTTAGDREAGWALPSLAAVPAGAPGRYARAGSRVMLGRRVVVELAGAVRDLAVADDGTLAVAAWIGGLDDPSVVLVR